MKTFAQIREYAMTRYQDVIRKQDEIQDNYTKVLGLNIYTQDYLKKIKEQGEAEIASVCADVANELEAFVKDAVAEKRTALNKMLADAPTTDQMNLLNSIQFQGTTITADEISSIALQLTGNYRALHALQIIAEKAGHRFHIPVQYDYQALSDALKYAEGYLNRVIRDLRAHSDYRKMDLDSKIFLNVWGNGDTNQIHDDLNYKTNVVDVLDANEQTSPTVEPRKLTDQEKAVVESLFTDGPSSRVMAMIMESPELRTLVSLHPKYKALLN